MSLHQYVCIWSSSSDFLTNFNFFSSWLQFLRGAINDIKFSGNFLYFEFFGISHPYPIFQLKIFEMGFGTGFFNLVPVRRGRPLKILFRKFVLEGIHFLNEIHELSSCFWIFINQLNSIRLIASHHHETVQTQIDFPLDSRAFLSFRNVRERSRI